MPMVRKVVGFVVGASALAVALHFIFSAFYEDAVDVDQIWSILNVFMAFGVLVAVAVWYLRKRVLDGRGGDGITREYLEVNLVFYVAAFLCIWFFWNWFDDLTVADGVQPETRLSFWGFIDPLYVLVACVTSCTLWCDRSHE